MSFLHDLLKLIFYYLQTKKTINLDSLSGFDTKILHFYDATGVVFYLLCGDKDNMVMEKLERHLDCKITEVHVF